ncbi:MAG: hypothetical protein ACK5L5_08450 [Bacteroidales bacterium]
MRRKTIMRVQNGAKTSRSFGKSQVSFGDDRDAVLSYCLFPLMMFSIIISSAIATR